MSLLQSRFAEKNAQHFDASSLTQLALLLDPAGNLSATGAGLRVTADATNGRGAIDPVADGGTSVLPTAGGADTTINNGTAIAFGDYYLVTSAGTVGTALTVAAGDVPALLIYNGGTITADAGWSLTKNTDTSGLTPNTRSILDGNGITGGGDLTADRTLSVLPDSTTGGDVKPVSVTGNGVGFDQSNIVADQITLAYAPAGVTADAAGAIAAGAPAGTVATDLAAVLEGMNDRITDSAGATVQLLHYSAAHAAAGLYTEGVSRVWGSDLQVYLANTAAAKGSAVDFNNDPVSGGSLADDWVRISNVRGVSYPFLAGSNRVTPSDTIAADFSAGLIINGDIISWASRLDPTEYDGLPRGAGRGIVAPVGTYTTDQFLYINVGGLFEIAQLFDDTPPSLYHAAAKGNGVNSDNAACQALSKYSRDYKTPIRPGRGSFLFTDEMDFTADGAGIIGDGVLRTNFIWGGGDDKKAIKVDQGGTHPLPTLSAVTGTFLWGDVVTGGTSGAKAVYRSLPGEAHQFHISQGAFTAGETVTGSKSGATATLDSINLTINNGSSLQGGVFKDFRLATNFTQGKIGDAPTDWVNSTGIYLNGARNSWEIKDVRCEQFLFTFYSRFNWICSYLGVLHSQNSKHGHTLDTQTNALNIQSLVARNHGDINNTDQGHGILFTSSYNIHQGQCDAEQGVGASFIYENLHACNIMGGDSEQNESTQHQMIVRGLPGGDFGSDPDVWTRACLFSGFKFRNNNGIEIQDGVRTSAFEAMAFSSQNVQTSDDAIRPAGGATHIKDIRIRTNNDFWGDNDTFTHTLPDSMLSLGAEQKQIDIIANIDRDELVDLTGAEAVYNHKGVDKVAINATTLQNNVSWAFIYTSEVYDTDGSEIELNFDAFGVVSGGFRVEVTGYDAAGAALTPAAADFTASPGGDKQFGEFSNSGTNVTSTRITINNVATKKFSYRIRVPAVTFEFESLVATASYFPSLTNAPIYQAQFNRHPYTKEIQDTRAIWVMSDAATRDALTGSYTGQRCWLTDGTKTIYDGAAWQPTTDDFIVPYPVKYVGNVTEVDFEATHRANLGIVGVEYQQVA